MKRVFDWLRIALALALVGLIIWRLADLQAVGAALLQANPLPMLGCVLIYFIGIWLSCLKWRSLLQAQGHHLPLKQLIGWYLLGGLGSMILPSSVGGDLGRGYIAGRAIGSQIDAWTSIVAERLTGLAALLILAAIALVIAPTLLGWPPLLPIMLFVVGSVGAIGLIWFLQHGPLLPAWVPKQVVTVQERLANVIARYRSQPNVILMALALSCAFHMLNAISTWLVALAINPQAPFQISLIAPLVGLAGLLPLTPGGLGIREGAMALLLERSGLTLAEAVATAFLSRALLLLTSLSGVPVLLTELRTKGQHR